MNRLPFEKRRQILHLMVEGNAIRGIARLVGVSHSDGPAAIWNRPGRPAWPTMTAPCAA